jgi:N-acetylglutamate synthase-like GNAT family acetyltransferase
MLVPMNTTGFRVRRATVDDLEQLGPLLRATQLPAADLEKRFTEFQVVEGTGGKLVGALGLQIAQKQGRLHSESFLDFGEADILRPLLWERLQAVAKNHGLVRLWTDETAPFWKQAGLESPSDEIKGKLPPIFADPKRVWLTIKLKEDIEASLSMDKEFTVFMQSEKARTEELLSQAKTFRFVAYLLGVLLFLFSLSMLGYWMMKKKQSGW